MSTDLACEECGDEGSAEWNLFDEDGQERYNVCTAHISTIVDQTKGSSYNLTRIDGD